MVKLFQLSQEYEKLHPNSESPRNWIMEFSIEDTVEILENANGREINVIYTDSPGLNNSGELVYIEN